LAKALRRELVGPEPAQKLLHLPEHHLLRTLGKVALQIGKVLDALQDPESLIPLLEKATEVRTFLANGRVFKDGSQVPASGLGPGGPPRQLLGLSVYPLRYLPFLFQRSIEGGRRPGLLRFFGSLGGRALPGRKPASRNWNRREEEEGHESDGRDGKEASLPRPPTRDHA
jgi:hypothetical protein